MIKYFWKYRFFNFLIILIGVIFCCLNINTFNVFFDSERIIELTDLEKDVIAKSIDDSNLLLVGLQFEKPLSFQASQKIDSILNNSLQNKYVSSIKSVFTERVLVNQSLIPVPIKIFNLKDQNSFNMSLRKIEKYKSNFVTPDLKNLIFVIKCKNLESEVDKIKMLDFLDDQFLSLNTKAVNITGQIKSEIYMKNNILKELVVFIILSSILCSLILFYFFKSYRLVIICLLSIFCAIVLAFSLSNFLFGGIELVMIIIPAIIFIIVISDFMHLLNISQEITDKFEFFNFQMVNIGKPVFLTSLTTAIGFLSFTFGSFEPLMRFGLITTLSIFTCLFIIVTFFALSIDFNLIYKNKKTNINRKIYDFLEFILPHKKWILGCFIILTFLGFVNLKIDNFLTDEINNRSSLFNEINYFEENFGGIKPLSFTLKNAKNHQKEKYVDFLKSNDVSIDVVFNQNDTTLIKTRIRDIGALESNILYEKVKFFAESNAILSDIGGVGYLFDQISNELTYEVLIGLIIAVLLVGLIFVTINNFNLRYLFVSLIPNLVPLFSCLGIFSLFGFYLSLSNAFIFAIVFGLIVDDSIHIISAYSVNRKICSVNDSINYCKQRTFNAVIKTTVVIIISLVPLLFSEFRSISQLASVTIISAIFALIFDVLYLPLLLRRFIG